MASQLRVQSIPAVFAFSNGQPVDGFMGAQTPTQVTEFIKKIVDGFGPEDDGLTTAIKNATEMLEQKDYINATEVFKAIIAEDNNILEAHVGLIKSLLGEKNIVASKLVADEIPQSLKADVEIKSLIAQIQILEQTLTIDSVSVLRESFLKDPENINIKFDLALALIAEEEPAEAIKVLLEIIKSHSEWNDGKAKVQILELLDALGPKDAVGRAGRRKLSSLIFT